MSEVESVESSSSTAISTTNNETLPVIDIDQSELEPLLTADKTNATKIRCTRCSSIVVSVNQASLLTSTAQPDPPSQHTLPLPLMTQQKSDLQQGKLALEQHIYYWLLSDMMKLDNAGFTHAVNDVKYVTCADCELGPIGYQRSDTKECLLALKRVKHE